MIAHFTFQIKLQVKQIINCASNSLLGSAFNQLNSGCSSQHLLNLHFPIVVTDSAVEVFLELAECVVINSDQVVGKMLVTFLVSSERSITHTELTVNLTDTFPRNKTKKIVLLTCSSHSRKCENTITIK